MNKRILLAATVALTLSSAQAQINRADPSGYFERATAMFETGNYAGCLDQMTEALRLDKDASFAEDARFYIALSAARQGRPDALSLLEQFTRDYPASPRRGIVTMATGDIFYDRGDVTTALHHYLSVDPSTLDGIRSEDYRYRLAYCRLMKNDRDDAGRLYRTLETTRRYGNDAMFYLGYIDYADGNYDEALARFRKVVPETSGPTSMTDFYLGQIYYMRRDYDKALTTSRRLLSLDGIGSEFRAEAARVAGESCYSLDRPDEAVTLLKQYVSLTDSPLPSALYVLGLSEYRTGDYLRAIDDLTPVTKQDNAMGQSAYLLIGQSYLREGNYNAALMALDKAYRMTFDEQIRETALYNYAVAKMQGGKIPFGSSVATFETFLRRYPDSRYAAEVQQYIVNGYMTDNNYEAALASINNIARPTDAVLDAKQQIAYTLGTRDLASGNTVGALNRFREAKALGKRNQAIERECDLWIGECLYKEGKYDQAAKSYRDYLKGPRTLPNRPLANYDLGYALFGEKKFDEAYSSFDSFITNPGNASSLMRADALNRMGDCLYYESSFDRAEKLYDRAYEADRQAGDYALFQKAIMKGLRRQHRAKIDGLDDMIARFPSSGLYPSALLEMADAWQELNDPRNAIATYNRLVENFPETAQGRQGRLLLAIAWLNDGNKAKAVETYREVITNYPSSDEAATAADDLKRIYADNGNLAEFVSFMKSVPNAPSVDPSEIEEMSFESASRTFEKTGETTRLEAYLKDYPDGRHVAEALLSLERRSSKEGKAEQTLQHASRIVTDYPHSPGAEEAYLLKAGAENDLDMTRTAMQTYAELETRASSSRALNAARLGIVRTALDLEEAETALTAADRLLSSTTIGSSDRDEVNFSRALALEQLNRFDQAEEVWNELAADPHQLYGAKAAFYLARHYYDNGDMKKSREAVERLVNANPPHIYWLARGFILLSDINRNEGNTFEADEYLKSLRENYPGTEPDIFLMIDQRLNK